MLYDSVIMKFGSTCPGESILILAKSFQCSSHTGMDQPPKAPDLQTFSVLCWPDGISTYTSDLGSVLVDLDSDLTWLAEKEPSLAVDNSQ